jgi:hypothetical protein
MTQLWWVWWLTTHFVSKSQPRLHCCSLSSVPAALPATVACRPDQVLCSSGKYQKSLMTLRHETVGGWEPHMWPITSSSQKPIHQVPPWHCNGYPNVGHVECSAWTSIKISTESRLGRVPLQLWRRLAFHWTLCIVWNLLSPMGMMEDVFIVLLGPLIIILFCYCRLPIAENWISQSVYIFFCCVIIRQAKCIYYLMEYWHTAWCSLHNYNHVSTKW